MHIELFFKLHFLYLNIFSVPNLYCDGVAVMRVNNREQRNLLHESIVTLETLYNFESKLLQTKQYFFHTITS